MNIRTQPDQALKDRYLTSPFLQERAGRRQIFIGVMSPNKTQDTLTQLAAKK